MSKHQQDSPQSDQHAISEDPRKRLEVLLKQSGNDVCADCASPDPKWVSINFGVFICIKCSGVHRSLGVHITKVFSVNLDEWTDEQVDFLIHSGGNNAVNEKYEAFVPEKFNKPDSESSIEYRSDFIRRKYELQQFSSYSADVLGLDPSLSVPEESTQDKKQAFCRNGTGLRQAIRNSLKWREAEQTVPKKSNSTAGMVEFVGLLKVNVVKGTNLATRDILRMTSDPYVVLSLGEQSLRTKTIKKNLNPVWNQSLMLSIPEHIPPLKLVVYDKDTFSSDDYMGEAEIDIEQLFLAAKANAGSRKDVSTQLAEQVASQVSIDDAGSKDMLLTKTDENVTQMSVKLQNVEKGVVDIELEIVPLTQ
ncbi:unnamed protein product [Rhodiola kirilowii]